MLPPNPSSPADPSSEIIRPVGILERFSTVRHSLGYYRSVANTARYTINARTQLTRERLASTIQTAVAKIVLQHPPLCCGVINEDKLDPAFARLASIDLQQCIEYQTLPAVSTQEARDLTLVKVIENQHNQFWPDLHQRPGWKLIIISPTPSSSPSSFHEERIEFDALFAFHHAFADGLSGVVFHRSLLSALNTTSSPLQSSIITIPSSITLCPPVEALIKFKISPLFLLKAVWKESRPKWLFSPPSPPWTGAICSPNPINTYSSRVLFFEFSFQTTTTILNRCRAEKSTLTGLLHGLILASLSKRIPTANSFTADTPYSLRFLTGLSATDAISMQVSGLSSTYKAATVNVLRTCTTPTSLANEIFTIARAFKSEMRAELARLPKNSLIGLLPYVDIHSMFTNRMGKPRTDTFEVSNVGALKGVSEVEYGDGDGDGVGDARWKIERSVFTQCGMGTGAAFGVNVASVEGGVLAISVTWLQDVIEEELVRGIALDMESSLRRLGRGEEVELFV